MPALSVLLHPQVLQPCVTWFQVFSTTKHTEPYQLQASSFMLTPVGQGNTDPSIHTFSLLLLLLPRSVQWSQTHRSHDSQAAPSRIILMLGKPTDFVESKFNQRRSFRSNSHLMFFESPSSSASHINWVLIPDASTNVDSPKRVVLLPVPFTLCKRPRA